MDEAVDGKIRLIVELDPATLAWQWGFAGEPNIEDFISPLVQVAQELTALVILQRRQKRATEQPKIILPAGPLPQQKH